MDTPIKFARILPDHAQPLGVDLIVLLLIFQIQSVHFAVVFFLSLHGLELELLQSFHSILNYLQTTLIFTTDVYVKCAYLGESRDVQSRLVVPISHALVSTLAHVHVAHLWRYLIVFKSEKAK